MIISLAYIVGMVVFLAAPVYRFFAYRMGIAALTHTDSLLSLAGAGIMSLLVAGIPLAAGLRKVGDWSSSR